MRLRARSWMVAAGLLGAVLTARPLAAQSEVPVEVQIALFANIWKLDRNLARPSEVTVAVLYQEQFGESVQVKNEFLAAAERFSPPIHCVAVEVGNSQLLLRRMSEIVADVVYVTPLRAIDVRDIVRISRQRGLRTFTGVPAYVEAGLAVGIGLRKDRPLIIINLAAARAEGASFSSQLLNLARIVGPL